MNRILLPYGKRNKYPPLSRELFWESLESNLYMYYEDHWILIAGNAKQFITQASDNLEIVFGGEDTEKSNPILRLKDNIDVDTITLGKYSGAARWSGMKKLGEVEGTTFFPILNYGAHSKEMVSGQFFIKIYRGDDVEQGMYHCTVLGNEKGSNFGSDSNNVKCTLNSTTFSDGEVSIGFKTFETLRKVITYKEVTGGEYGLTKEIDFVINSKDSVYFASSDGERALFTNRFDIISTGTDSAADEYGCHWYELSMKDFRAITDIPLYTGSNLDLYDNSCYVYFDIYINDQSQFSIDRAFITHERATAGNEDTIVSDGKIWCHNPYWLTPNDKSTVDVSNGFVFLDNVFDDSSNNLNYTPGVGIKIMDVYMVIPGQTTTIATTTNEYLPPDKIELWFNGWDTRTTYPTTIHVDRDIESTKVIARN